MSQMRMSDLKMIDRVLKNIARLGRVWRESEDIRSVGESEGYYKSPAIR